MRRRGGGLSSSVSWRTCTTSLSPRSFPIHPTRDQVADISSSSPKASLTVFCSQILYIFFSNRILNLCCNKFDHYTLNVDFLCFLFRSYENVDDLDVETWWLFLYMPVEVDYFWNLLKGQSCYFNQRSQALGRSTRAAILSWKLDINIFNDWISNEIDVASFKLIG